jgi:stalled ribosome rescue protein Dom34
MATTATKIGIWMDYSIAHLMEFSNNPFEVNTIESDFTHQEKMDSLLKGEHHLQIKEQQKQSKYYKKLMAVVKKYNEVILFGPTNAKEELFNVIVADNRFHDIKIQVKQTDKMTPKQQHAFVRDFFATN